MYDDDPLTIKKTFNSKKLAVQAVVEISKQIGADSSCFAIECVGYSQITSPLYSTDIPPGNTGKAIRYKNNPPITHEQQQTRHRTNIHGILTFIGSGLVLGMGVGVLGVYLPTL